MIIEEWPIVGDCLLLCSTRTASDFSLVHNKWGRPLQIFRRHNFHLIFDNGIGYNTCTRICHVLAGLNILERDYMKIREFRGDMTLRVGPSILYDKVKPIPETVDYVHNPHTLRKDGYIIEYLMFKKNVEDLFSSKQYTKA